jgi:hypothetical protein
MSGHAFKRKMLPIGLFPLRKYISLDFISFVDTSESDKTGKKNATHKQSQVDQPTISTVQVTS